MICYRDMTFCQWYKDFIYGKDCIHGKECPRACTQEVMDKAKAINLPISLFMDKPKCFEEAKR